MKHVKQHQYMIAVVARLAGADIINNHVPNVFHAMLLAGEILSKRRSGDLGYMFVLGDREYLLFGKAAKSHAILKGNHAP